MHACIFINIFASHFSRHHPLTIVTNNYVVLRIIIICIYTHITAKDRKKNKTKVWDVHISSEIYESIYMCVCRTKDILKKDSSNSPPLSFYSSSPSRSCCTVYVFLCIICTTMIDITHEQQQQQQPSLFRYDKVKNRYGKGWAKREEWIDRWIEGVIFERDISALYNNVKKGVRKCCHLRFKWLTHTYTYKQDKLSSHHHHHHRFFQ